MTADNPNILRGHAECPFGDGWKSTSWENNQDREIAMQQWREHKKTHTRYGPIFVKEKVCICGPQPPNGQTIRAGCEVHNWQLSNVPVR